MRNIIVLMLISISILIASCASPYKPEGFGGGYSETQLDENIFKVSFRGNRYTSSERAIDLALLRSADLTLQNGYSYFIIINSYEYSTYTTQTTPTRIETSGEAFSNGNTAFGSSTTTIHPGNTYEIKRPHTTNTIVCFKEKPRNINGILYNAKIVYDSLSKKYK